MPTQKPWAWHPARYNGFTGGSGNLAVPFGRLVQTSGCLMRFFKSPYLFPLLFAFAIQIFLFLFTACGSPPDTFFLASLCPSFVFWVTVAVIFVNKRSPTANELAFVRWGLLPFGFLGTIVMLIFWDEIAVLLNLPPPRHLQKHQRAIKLIETNRQWNEGMNGQDGLPVQPPNP
jgi:hypothetical protein